MTALNSTERILKNFIPLSVAELLSKFLLFISVTYLARTLSPGGFGKINFATALLAYFALMSSLGLDILGTRELSCHREKIKDYVGNILLLRLLLALASFLLLALTASILSKSSEIRTLILLYGLSLFPSALLIDWAFQAMEKMVYAGLASVVRDLTFVLALLLVVKSHQNLLLVPVLQTLALLIASSLLLLIFRLNWGNPKFSLNFDLWRDLLKRAIPIGFSLFVVPIFISFDVVLLGLMRSNEEVGYYSAAYKIILFLTGLIGVYYTAAFPIFSQLYRTSLKSLQKAISHSVKLAASVALPLGIGGTLVAKPLLIILFGQAYSKAAPAFQILIWAVVIIYLNIGYSRALLATNGEKYFAWGVIVPALSNLLLNFILIPPWGMVGAAIATLVAEAAGFAIMYWGLSRLISAPFSPFLPRPLLASLPMAAWILVFSQPNLLFLIFQASLVYFLSLYLVKGVTRDEIGVLIQTLSARKSLG